MERRKVLLVYPRFPLSYWGFQYALPLFGKRAMHPPLGLITIAALCPPEFEFRLVDLNIESLSDDQILWADMVFFSAMAIQQRSLLDELARCRRLGRKTVVGGPFASGHPERIGTQADCLVLGEAEITLKPFLADLAKGTLQPVYTTDLKPDVTTSPVPRFDLLKLSAYSVIDIQFSRGCPFNCEFCDIITLYGRVPRAKTPDQLIAEMTALHDLGYRGPIFLVDDNFIGNKKAVKALLEKMIPWMQAREYPFFVTTEASINLADDEGLLRSMRLAGFKRVFAGIETPSAESLKESQKYQNTRRDMVTNVHRIIDHGMEVMAGFIVGFDSDKPDIFERQIEFIEEAQIPWAMVGTLTAIPNTQLWTRLEKEGRLRGYADGDQFGRPNFQTTLDGDVLYHGYLKILETVYDPDRYYRRVLDVLARHDRANLPNLHEKNYPKLKVAFLTIMAIVLLGIRAPYRRSFWRYFASLVRHHPRQFVPGLVNAIIGHHFILYTREIMARERAHPTPLPVRHAEGPAAGAVAGTATGALPGSASLPPMEPPAAASNEASSP